MEGALLSPVLLRHSGQGHRSSLVLSCLSLGSVITGKTDPIIP